MHKHVPFLLVETPPTCLRIFASRCCDQLHMLVHLHPPTAWQPCHELGVGRLLSSKNGLFSGSSSQNNSTYKWTTCSILNLPTSIEPATGMCVPVSRSQNQITGFSASSIFNGLVKGRFFRKTPYLIGKPVVPVIFPCPIHWYLGLSEYTQYITIISPLYLHCITIIIIVSKCSNF